MSRPALQVALGVVALSLIGAGVSAARPGPVLGEDGCDGRSVGDPFGCASWVLTAASGEGPYSAWVEDARVRLRSDRVDGAPSLIVGTDCLVITVPYTIERGVLVPDGEVVSRDVCDGSDRPAAVRLEQLLSAPSLIGGTPEDVVLDGRGGTVTFSRIPG